MEKEPFASRALAAVDVVVVSWNVRAELLSCLASVLASDGVEVRLIVVDNASTDGTPEYLQALAAGRGGGEGAVARGGEG